MAGYKAALRVWRGDAGTGELADYQVVVNEGLSLHDLLIAEIIYPLGFQGLGRRNGAPR